MNHSDYQELRKKSVHPPIRHTLFAHSTSDALACKEAALEYHRILFSDRYMVLADGTPRTQEEQNAILAIRRDAADDYRMLPSLPVFFWSSATATVVRDASKSYPLPDTENAPFLPAHLARGFAVFEAPVLGAVVDGGQASFSALSWFTATATRYNNWPVMVLTGYNWNASICSPIWWATVGAHWLQQPDDPTFKDEQALLTRWLLSAIMFMEQAIIESQATRVGGQVGKRAEKAHLPRDVHVVGLRRVIRQRSDSDTENGTRDWDHRWMVRGHWRRQWYPKAERNVPIFIHPHIKGPEDKPLKTPSAEVFAVTR